MLRSFFKSKPRLGQEGPPSTADVRKSSPDATRENGDAPKVDFPDVMNEWGTPLAGLAPDVDLSSTTSAHTENSGPLCSWDDQTSQQAKSATASSDPVASLTGDVTVAPINFPVGPEMPTTHPITAVSTLVEQLPLEPGSSVSGGTLPGDLEALTSRLQEASVQTADVNPRPESAASDQSNGFDRIRILVISLEKDQERRDAIAEQAARFATFEIEFVPGVDGGQLSTHICKSLTRDSAWALNKGTVGCFLSHVKAWEAAAAGTADWSVIIEDDVDFQALTKLGSISLPEDAEIVFLNDRMAASSSDGPLRTLPIWHALQKLDKLGSGGPGGDGYLLKKSAAQALLAACSVDLYYGHVDGRLLRYATSQSDLDLLPQHSWIAGVVRKHHHHTLVPKLGLIKGYCLSAPLIRHKGIASTREAVDVAPRIKLKGLSASPAEPASSKNTVSLKFWNRIANIGDAVNPYLIEAISGSRPIFCESDREPHVLAVGSILFMATPASHVWGSGILDPEAKLPAINPLHVHAVRGSRTRDLLSREYRLKDDIALGDPGSLVTRIREVSELRLKTKLSRRIGVIPHYALTGSRQLSELATRLDAAIVSPRTGNLEFFAHMFECEIVVSQSLHGLVFAEAFGIPWIWLSDDMSPTWTFKFHDWFTNLERKPLKPTNFSATRSDVLAISSLGGLKTDLQQLANSLPSVPSLKKSYFGFRDCRRAIPVRVAVNCTLKQNSSMFDYFFSCENGDESKLRAFLLSLDRDWDESRIVLVAFDHDLAGRLRQVDVASLIESFTTHPLLEFITIVSAENQQPIISSASPLPRDKKLKTWDETAAWQGVVLIRRSANFSFSLAGALALEQDF